MKNDQRLTRRESIELWMVVLACIGFWLALFWIAHMAGKRAH